MMGDHFHRRANLRKYGAYFTKKSLIKIFRLTGFFQLQLFHHSTISRSDEVANNFTREHRASGGLCAFTTKINPDPQSSKNRFQKPMLDSFQSWTES